MLINQKKKSYKKTIVITCIVLVTILVISFVGYWYTHKDTHIPRDANGVSTQRTPHDLNLEQELIRDLSKKLKAIAADRPVAASIDQSTHKQQANVVLTHIGATERMISASGFISNVVESDGVCIFRFIKGSKSIEKNATTLSNPSSTTCKTVRFSASELGVGTWQVQLDYRSSRSTGVSGILEVTLKPPVAKASNYDAGHIIDDTIFYDSTAFSSAQGVQDFIKSHTPQCDTWGLQPSGHGDLTRAQYAQQVLKWPGPPYVCLQNYYENPTTGATSFENGGGAFPGGISAGQIIYEAALKYGINPKVLLVMLKKESPGPLYADSWPTKIQYRYAMGYACPDGGPEYSAACVSSKAGFYKQINFAAWQLREYVNNIGSYHYQPTRWNYIQYNPNQRCGKQSVYIDNLATASLYNYTPYVPSRKTLRSYPDTTPCGAYGDLNFFVFFNEWFGSTSDVVPEGSSVRR